ncbi:hypothetical protein KY360_05145 [Candidatus Woesearchaeota archaeon]|nr:hypothetical protein [Candidatus Woesearchaeota archaeon]
MGEKRDAKLFLWSGLFSSIAILGFILVIFEFHRFFFIAEFIVLLVLGFVALIGLAAIYNGLSFGFGFLSFMFGLMLLNLLLVYFKTKPIGLTYLTTIVSSSIGFVLSVVNLGEEPEEELIEEPEEIEEPEYKEEAVKKTFSPGKVLASKTGSYYHAPKCEWAKKIKTKNRVWLESEEEAMKQGLKAHECIK